MMVSRDCLALRPQEELVDEITQRPWFYILEDTEIDGLNVSSSDETRIFMRDENRK